MEVDRDCLSEISLEVKIITKFLDSLDSSISYKTGNLLTWFKELCGCLTKLLILITKLHKNRGECTKNEDLLVYLNQLLSCLSFFVNTFVSESDKKLILIIARDFCVKRMKWCLNGIQETLLNPVDKVSSNFIKWMDIALDKINEIDYENQKSAALSICEETEGLIEEVLSHAMSIAQVALTEDGKIIRGCSQSVLEAYNDLNTEIKKTTPNIPMVNLLVDTCSNELCALERCVNTTVLKLSLKVFSEYTIALEFIHSSCFKKTDKGKANDLDTFIMDFDLHIDRIMQIGIFAVSCSTSTKICTKIRSCLASLEALESELVPAYTAVFLDSSPYNVELALLLREHWLHQAQMLQDLIFLIIDPFAFCQVIYEENKRHLQVWSDNIKNDESSLNKPSLTQLLRNSKVLKRFIQIILKELQETNKEKIEKAFRNFNLVLHEVYAACEISTDEKSFNLRILKRVKILISSTKYLWNCFSDTVEDTNCIPPENKANERDDKCLLGNPFLDHIISKGKQILKDRSILYRSSRINENCGDIKATTLRKINDVKGQNKSLPLLKLVHLRKLSFMNSCNKNDTCSELQLTDILNELNNMTKSSLGAISQE